LGSDWKPLVGGLIAFILPVLNILLWPILVGAMTKGQSIGKLLIASIVGAILGIIVCLILASTIGQNPSWVATGFTVAMAVWGAVVGTAMSVWGIPSAMAG
jgi:hypothetical protein